MTGESKSLCAEGSAIWEAIHARLDGEEHRGVFVAPLTNLLDQIRERVDEQTWDLVLDVELRAGLEVMAGVQIGLELGYERGRAAVVCPPAPCARGGRGAAGEQGRWPLCVSWGE